MDKIKNYKIYLAFTKGRLKRAITYKSNVLIGTIGKLIMISITFFLWKAIYSSSTTGIMRGFTINEMLTYIMISFVVGIVTSVNTGFVVGDEVRSGAVAMSLIKPISYRKRVIFMGLGEFIFSFIFLFLPGTTIVTIYAIKVGVNVNIISMILFVISLFLGFLINVYYSYLFGLLAFKFYSTWGLSQIANAIIMLVSGALVPLTFFPKTIEKIFEILPFSSIIYTPTMIYLNKVSTIQAIEDLFIQLVWVIIFIILSKIIWKRVVNMLVIQGG